MDLDGLPANLVDTLAAAAGADGVVVHDADGLQPLLGLWRTAALATAATSMLDAGESAARRLVARLQVSRCDVSPHRILNLNFPHDFPEGYAP
ncbi:hypothetical protein [Arenimonas daejeonensis]|uniref:hypothetical protein n=1 Tax=Arenimonas daejeonensis TaxID=370777 RepID=UPI0011BF704A|nr:hypothetical protein [Arenimonas daejeonensis]